MNATSWENDHANKMIKLMRDEEIDSTQVYGPGSGKPSDTPMSTGLARAFTPNQFERAKTAYHLIGSERRANEATDEDQYEPEVNPVDDENFDTEEPYVISEEKFSEENLHYDKITVTYYAEDDVLTDDQETVIDDLDATVGYDNLDLRYAALTNPHVIYVRNDSTSSDYEILINLNSYQETVLGLVMTPNDRQRATARRKGFTDDE